MIFAYQQDPALDFDVQIDATDYSSCIRRIERALEKHLASELSFAERLARAQEIHARNPERSVEFHIQFDKDHHDYYTEELQIALQYYKTLRTVARINSNLNIK